MTFEIKDSGERQEFSGGMVRDTTEGKIDWLNLRFGPLYRRIAEHLTKGREKYPDPLPGVPNWTLAEGEEEALRAKSSAARHFEQWLNGDVDEDHAAAVVFNMNLFEYVREKDPSITPGFGTAGALAETPYEELREAMAEEFSLRVNDEPASKPWHIEPQDKQDNASFGFTLDLKHPTGIVFDRDPGDETPVRPTFEVGDVVLCRTDEPMFNGVGTIIRRAGDGHPREWIVKMDYDGAEWGYDSDELTLTPLKETVVGHA